MAQKSEVVATGNNEALNVCWL